MVSTILSTLRGVLTLSLVFINTVFWFLLVFPVAFIKISIPIKTVRLLCAKVLIFIAESWIDVNNLILGLAQNIVWEIEGNQDLLKKSWYLVLSNHQSWLDVLVLQKTLNHKIPFLKFFLKKNLIWMPFLGQVWWALDMPFMQRYSQDFLAKHPELKGRDLAITRKACEKFKDRPVSVINFVEGTRFTPAKHQRKKSPYRHLLPPKAGGVAFVLSSMGSLFQHILDVTIAYPEKNTTLWDFACGRVHKIRVSVRKIPVPQQLLNGDYAGDPKFQALFQAWINQLWQEKDGVLDRMVG